MSPSVKVLRILNGYATPTNPPSRRSIPPIELFENTAIPVLLLGDLNIPNPLSDLLWTFTAEELRTSSPYYDRASELGYTLLNTPGEYIRFSFITGQRPSVIDPAFANSPLAPYVDSWSMPLDSTGSDHVHVIISLATPARRNMPPVPNWVLTDWPTLDPILKRLATPPPPSSSSSSTDLDAWFDLHYNKLAHLLLSHTPTKRPSHNSKPWWTAALTSFRKILNRALRLYKTESTPLHVSNVRSACKTYLSALRKQKKKHWSSFLAGVTKDSIWDARRLAAGRPPPRFPSFPHTDDPLEINNSLLNYFFPARPPPPPPPTKIYPSPPILETEIQLALRSSSSKSAPGPDSMPYGIWKHVHLSNPLLLLSLLSPLLRYGYHPSSLKKASGIVLDKPGKSSYDSPASFRVIVLLPTLSKILERIVAMRLTPLSRSLKLVHHLQCGSLPSLSTVDAVATLTNEVRALQKARLQVSTLFVDIKEGFDNVRTEVLCPMLSRSGVPPYLTSWIDSFLHNRRCALLFQGSPRAMEPITVGAPQGSPLFPLLFVIYISSLYVSIPKGLVISYVDDLAITSASPTYSENTRQLKTSFAQILDKASLLQVSFSVPKTELIHWRPSRQRGPSPTSTITLLGETFHPSSLVRWLGYWLPPSLHSSPHFLKRLALAQGALAILRQLLPPGKGIPPYLNHRLLNAIIFPILSYGADLLVPTESTLSKIKVLWNKAMRWSNNLFSATPNSILPCEAATLPVDLALIRQRRLAAFRIACADPAINPASARLSVRFPSHSKYRSPSSYRSLNVKGAYSLLAWNSTPRKAPGAPSHLPLDSLLHSISHLPHPTPFPPKSNHPSQPKDPPDPPSHYQALRSTISSSTFKEWSLHPGTSKDYLFAPSTSPHPFMGLDCFTAGRIHQMRSGKSYLAAHPTWSTTETDPTCKRCLSSPEDMDHAILLRPSTQALRSSHMPSVKSCDRDSPLWTSVPLLLELRSFIHAARINYPPNTGFRLPGSPPPALLSPPPSPYLHWSTPPGYPLSPDVSDSK